MDFRVSSLRSPCSTAVARRRGERSLRVVVATAVVALLAAMVPAGAPRASADLYDNTGLPVWEFTGGAVRDIATDGPRVFVGGAFSSLREGPGEVPVAQPWLAALDDETGVHDPAFAPVLDGEVWGLEVSDDGSMLYVAGSFAQVNGVARRGVVALDPITGATIGGFGAETNNEVYDIDLAGGQVYMAGSFSLVDGTLREKIARVDAMTGAVDATWGPFADAGNANAIAVDPVLGRVYLGGFFTGIDAVPGTEFLTSVSLTTGAVLAGFDPTPEGGVYDILARPGRVYAATGGPGGRVEVLDTVTGDRFGSLDGDGDLQVLAASGSDVYAGGHHSTGLGGGPASPVARIDGATDAVDPAFGPDITSQVGEGVWALLATDTDLWVGGAITGASPVAAVGVARYPATIVEAPDSVAPTAPAALGVDGVSDLTIRLSWVPGVDASGVVDHVIERDGVPLGSTRGSTFIDTSVEPNTSYDYVVRAVDLAGNVSPDSLTVSATTLGPLTELTIVPFGASWSYLDSGPEPDPSWRDVAFDDTSWPTGDAELGRGDGDEVTVMSDRDVNYLRHTFMIGADQAVAAATLQYLRDDGVVVSVNGVEVGRDNVPDGPIGPDTTASSYVFGAQEGELAALELDPSLFVVGSNTLAVSLHDAPGSGDASFDAQLAIRVGSLGDDVIAPSAPTGLTVDAMTEGSARVSWQPATDNVAVTAYEVRRDGVAVGTTTATVYTDGGLSPETTYQYTVVALDAAANVGPAAGPVQATTTAVPNGPVILVDGATTWAIDDSGTVPPTDWTTRLTPPATWASGTTEVGVGDGGESTLVAARPVIHVSTVFDVGNPAAIGALTLELLADDGAVVYVNGSEVVRDNVAPGPVDATTPAQSYRWTVQDETVPLSWQVPAGVLVSGANVLAVSVHNAPFSSDMSFDASFTAVYQQGPDTQAPTAPSNLAVTDASPSTVSLDWDAAFDNVAVAGYRILRDGVQVGDVLGTSFDDTGLSPSTGYDYTVLAYDLAGNEGPPAGPITAQTAGPVFDVVPVDAVWRYLDSGVDPGPAWAESGFDDSAWPAGAAELGASDGDETTVVTNRPVVWFRTDFDLVDASMLARLDLHLLADDGAAVYLNGAEVARDNLPAGELTAATPASTYRWSTVDETTFRTFGLPVGGLQVGSNMLAIRVHNGLGSGDLSFAARLEVQEGDQPDETPPSAPGAPVADEVTASSVSLSWAEATDDVAVDHYLVLRDGVLVATTFVTNAVDAGLDPLTTYQYTVQAVDAAGNVGPLSPSLDVATLDAPPQPDTLVALDGSWRYLDDGADPGPDWTTVAFDDGGWTVGAAELGAGDGDEVTVIANQPVVWFRAGFSVADPAVYTTANLELLADDGAVVWLNGTELIRDNVGAGPLDASTPPLTTRFGSAESEVRIFSVDPALLVAGPNVLAVSLHNAPGSSDLSLAAGLSAQ